MDTLKEGLVVVYDCASEVPEDVGMKDEGGS